MKSRSEYPAGAVVELPDDRVKRVEAGAAEYAVEKETATMPVHEYEIAVKPKQKTVKKSELQLAQKIISVNLRDID